MKISFENPDKVNGLLTLTVETADFQDRVEKTLKDLRKKAQLPGFRPGQVPMGMIKRQYGEGVKAEEINKIIGEELYKYVNEIQTLGSTAGKDDFLNLRRIDKLAHGFAVRAPTISLAAFLDSVKSVASGLTATPSRQFQELFYLKHQYSQKVVFSLQYVFVQNFLYPGTKLWINRFQIL